ncbi:unnamed protein product [Schistosoma curassoni]|uniref:MULE domain-containing protein n=1 Tax=Schistosoma curassoni TaxID=6186 RepID=A0A183K7H6_9TREM|nr:unnamed protein product [Schistosoma curassoni]
MHPGVVVHSGTRTQSKFLDCQSKFRVRLEEQGYVIKSYKVLHNHPCSSFWMVCDPWTRRLSSEEKENSKPVILQSRSTDEVIESVKEKTGKVVTAADVKTMKAKLSTGGNGFAATKRYSLFQLVATDNFGRGRSVMFAWTRKEMRADVKWILEKFKEIMGTTTRTETFVMDCERAESATVRITHGHANIILCVFHVCRAFRKKVHQWLFT